MRLKACLLSVALAVPSLAAQEKVHEIKNQNATFSDKKIGVVRFTAQYIGEPVSQPTEFEVSVICPGRKKKKIVKKWNSCVPLFHEYDKEGKVLTVKHLKGRAHANGSSHCDQEEMEEIRLAQSCE